MKIDTIIIIAADRLRNIQKPVAHHDITKKILSSNSLKSSCEPAEFT